METNEPVRELAPSRAFYVLSGLPLSVGGFLWLIIPTWFAHSLLAGEGGTTGERFFIALILIPFFGIGLYGVVYPAKRYLEHPRVRYIVTERNITLTGGLGTPTTRRIPLESVRSLEARRGLFGFWKSLGEVEISTGESIGRRPQLYTIVGVENPEDLAETIDDLRAKYRERWR